MKRSQILERILRWKESHITPRNFIYLLSFIIGILSGLAAVFLKNVAVFTQYLILNNFPKDKINYLYLFLPLVGITLTVIFVRYVVKDDISHGISKVLHAISRQRGMLKPHNNYSSVVASILTVGFGGSVGLEAPIVLTGSSLASSLGRIFRVNYKTSIILLGCGAAGAISGIFKAPIAAVIFALEVLMLDLTLWSIIPLLISAVTALTISYFFLGKAEIFSFNMTGTFVLTRIPLYIILGIFCGLVAFYFTKGTLFIESLFERIKKPFVRSVTGGLILGILILLLPPLFGEGYKTLDALLSGNPAEITYGSLFYGLQDNIWMFGLFLLLILIFKVAATSITNGAGGIGGIFAPTLFMGGISGYFIARVINSTGIADVSERNFSLVGMAGMMASVMHAPLTAIFLIAEITGGYGLLLPLILTSTIAYITVIYFEPHSIYTIRLAQRGELITHHKDKAVLTLIDLLKVVENDFVTLSAHDKLGDLVNAIARSKRNFFPVLKDDMLIGIVLLDDIRHIMFNTDMYNTVYVRDLMMLPPTHISPGEPMDEVMKKFDETGSWNLPVIKNGKYIGFISKSKLFSVYRKLLIDISAEE